MNSANIASGYDRYCAMLLEIIDSFNVTKNLKMHVFSSRWTFLMLSLSVPWSLRRPWNTKVGRKDPYIVEIPSFFITVYRVRFGNAQIRRSYFFFKNENIMFHFLIEEIKKSKNLSHIFNWKPGVRVMFLFRNEISF